MNSEGVKDLDSVLRPDHWVDEHGDVLFRYAYFRTGDRDAAEDLVQETFLAALQGYKNFEGRCTLRTWLVSILHNKILEYFRKSHQELRPTSQVNSKDQDFFENGKWKEIPTRWSVDPEKEANNKEFQDVLVRCMRRLSSALADAFILRELKLMDPGEICEQLKISDTGLWSRLHRARLNLRNCLEKNWFSSQ